jgi:hypothetical protein
MRVRIILSVTAILAFDMAPICKAQLTPESVDQIGNWPAPLYWQPGSPHSGHTGHHGRVREDAAKSATSTPGAPAIFVAMSPCRIVDTRNPLPPFGGPVFYAGEIRTIPMAASTDCTIPATAVAYSLNIAVMPVGTTMRWLIAWDTGSPQPNASTINDKAGLITSNSAVVPAGTGGAINIFAADTTHVIIDVNGYYATQANLPLTGTAVAPALSFGNTSTGFYSDPGGGIGISTAGINRLTVRADGDLELPGSIRKSGYLFLHNRGAGNTAVGQSALEKTEMSSGGNTAIGTGALAVNTIGNYNTATGLDAMLWNTTGSHNSATGSDALRNNSMGTANTAMGENALWSNTTGSDNSAFGARALNNLTAGDSNTAIGVAAGTLVTSGSYNVHIANQGTAADSNTIRIGYSHSVTGQSRTFIAAIRGTTTGNADAIPVVIDSSGQLGTVSSSRRVKRDVRQMHDTKSTIMSLRPVEFRYIAHGPDSSLQYGLIAEEVSEMAPDLVACNKDGEVETVYYDKVNAMLLNHVQKLTQEKDALADTVRRLESRLAGLESKAK